MEKKTLKVGVLQEWRPSTYTREMRKELERAAPSCDVALSFLGVQWANSTDGDDPKVIERTLALAEDFDAMVLISGVFSHGVNGLSRFAQKWAPRPIVSVGYRLPGVHSLLVDNRSAVRAATSHLIDAHQRKKLLFVRGRKDSQEAEERYLGYRHALRDHRMLNDESRLLEGEFTRHGAIRAMQALDRSIDYDGIVAANDDMALAILAEVRRRGLRVPEDVAIIGFDDVPEAASSNPPLSTMAQPFSDMARHALQSLLDQRAGKHVDLRASISARLVSRASCCKG